MADATQVNNVVLNAMSLTKIDEAEVTRLTAVITAAKAKAAPTKFPQPPADEIENHRVFMQFVQHEEWKAMGLAFIANHLQTPYVKFLPVYCGSIALALTYHGNPQSLTLAKQSLEQFPAEATAYVAIARLALSLGRLRYARIWAQLATLGINIPTFSLSLLNQSIDFATANYHTITATLKRRMLLCDDASRAAIPPEVVEYIEQCNDLPESAAPRELIPKLAAQLRYIPSLNSAPQSQADSEFLRLGASAFQVIASRLPIPLVVALSRTCRLLFSWVYDPNATVWKELVYRQIGVPHLESYLTGTPVTEPFAYLEYARRMYLMSSVSRCYTPCWSDAYLEADEEQEQKTAMRLISKSGIFESETLNNFALPEPRTFLAMQLLSVIQMDKTNASAKHIAWNTSVVDTIISAYASNSATIEFVAGIWSIALQAIFSIVPDYAVSKRYEHIPALIRHQIRAVTSILDLYLPEALSLTITSASRRLPLPVLPCAPDFPFELTRVLTPLTTEWTHLKKVWSENIWHEIRSHCTTSEYVSDRLDEGILRLTFVEEKPGLPCTFTGFGYDTIFGAFTIEDGALSGLLTLNSKMTFTKKYDNGKSVPYTGGLLMMGFVGLSDVDISKNSPPVINRHHPAARDPKEAGTWLISMTTSQYSEANWQDLKAHIEERAKQLALETFDYRLFKTAALKETHSRLRINSAQIFDVSLPSTSFHTLALLNRPPDVFENATRELLPDLFLRRSRFETPEKFQARSYLLTRYTLINVVLRYALTREYAAGTTLLQDDLEILRNSKDEEAHVAVFLRWGQLLHLSAYESYGQIFNLPALKIFLENAAKPYSEDRAIEECRAVIRMRPASAPRLDLPGQSQPANVSPAAAPSNAKAAAPPPARPAEPKSSCIIQ